MVCSVEGCEKEGAVLNKTLCRMHYDRHHKYGDVHFRKKRGNGEGTLSKDKGRWLFTDDGRQKQRAVLIAEKVLGKKLPKGALVHHVDADSMNDANNNLVILQDQSLHMLVEYRTKAFLATGNARAE